MEQLQQLDKPFIRELCQNLSLDSSGSKRQLLSRIVDKGISEEVIECFVEDILERQGEEAHKIEQERRKREEQEREIQLQKEREDRELRQLELQVEMERIRASNGSSPSTSSLAVRSEVSRVKISQYMTAYEVGNDIGLFLTNFERLGSQLGVPQDQWATQLLKLLPTEVATVVARMPTDEASLYDSVKRSLLERFKLSPEAFRQRFRKASRQPGQPYSELAYYLQSNLHEWIKGAGAGDSVETLTELMALEQFYEILPNNLKYWILDRAPKSLRDACRLADEYEERRERQGGETGFQKEKPNGKAKFKFSKNGKPKGSDSKNESESQKEKIAQEDATKAETALKRDLNKPRELTCFNCGQKGHYAKTCNKPKLLAVCLPEKYQETAAGLLNDYKMKICVNGKEVSSLRDTGATFDVVEQSLVSKDDYTGEEACFRQALDPHPWFLPLARVRLEGTFGKLETVAAVAKHPPASYILSNQTAAMCPEIDRKVFPVSVITRQKAKLLNQQFANEIDKNLSKQEKEPAEESILAGSDPLSEQEGVGADSCSVVPGESEKGAGDSAGPVHSVAKPVGEAGEELGITREEFLEQQKGDASLRPLFEKAAAKEIYKGCRFALKSDLLTRVWRDKNGREGDQLVVPTKLRRPLIEFAHSNSFSGHLGLKKSKSRFLQEFYFPGFFREMKEVVSSCPVCQKVGNGKDRIKAPLCRVPLISQPFQRLSVDVVGPLPTTKEGYRYILTIQCMATRFPDGVPLKELNSESVVEALLTVFSRYGFAREVQTDLGSVFTSNLMKVFTERSGVKQLFSSPYHPESNPVERMHGTLKKILKSLLLEKGREWVDWLPMVFFAIRQMPNESLGFSPAELVFGRQLRGPLSVIREQWSPKTEEKQTVVAYVLDLLERLKQSTELAKQFQSAAREKYKSYYDKTARLQKYKEGDSVLILVPSRPHKLAVKWEGPVKVAKQLSEVNYIVEGVGKRKKQRVVHVNLMKPFRERICLLENIVNSDDSKDLPDLVTLQANSEGEFLDWVDNTVGGLELPEPQGLDIKNILKDYEDVFSSKPGLTSIIQHDIEVSDNTPITVPIYRTNPRIKEIIRQEIDLMTSLNLIKPSTSEYSAPLIIVEAEGKEPRACVDFRKLNQVTRIPQYPMANVDDKIEQVAKAKWVTCLDLNRGYWQVPLTEAASEKAAFSCFLGSFQPTVLFFGLAGAPGTFQKLMDTVLKGCEEFTSVFLDDIAIYSESWEAHIEHVRIVLERLRQANLVVKRKKCQWAQKKILYLGHLIGQGELSPSERKVSAIVNLTHPQTKKDVKTFLGMVQYYKRYIPNLSDIATPLTDALGKDAPSQVCWTEECDQAFRRLKGILVSQPIVRAPDYDLEFIVQTDASSRAVSCVLSQRDAKGEEHPVVYLSRKLQPRETRWSTIERECLALIWGIEKLKPYLQLNAFVLETDHCPLQFLHSMSQRNSRLLRWSLALQQYKFSVRYRKGKLNANADCLSRLSG